MDLEEYINQLNKIVNLAKNGNSKFIFIAPWFSTRDDKISRLNLINEKKRMKKYSLELKKYIKKRICL